MDVLEVYETDEVGRPTSTFLVSPETDARRRIDIVSTAPAVPLLQRLLAVFLPTGYPHTVSADYTSYQIYDSLQAFSSSIAGLLASRAVLQGLGVGDENATATAAMLLNVLQESMGRFATICFAHWASQRIGAECKAYRLAADIFNDCAFVMDCLSPSLPKSIRIPLLCMSSVFRAICGVAGGSSKAILSNHFARSDNIGELNAKDGSQETVISLLGMWAGGLVVSRVSSGVATWAWLLSLLAVHLATNYMAVRSVCMSTLNRQRANIVFSELIDTGKVLIPSEVASVERVFDRDGVLRWKSGTVLGSCKIGVSFRHFLHACSCTSIPGSSSLASSSSLPSLLAIFEGEDYLLWFDRRSGFASIVLKSEATSVTHLKAWSHALRVGLMHRNLPETALDPPQAMHVVKSTLDKNNEDFDDWTRGLHQAGWDVSVASLATSPPHCITVPKKKVS